MEGRWKGLFSVSSNQWERGQKKNCRVHVLFEEWFGAEMKRKGRKRRRKGLSAVTEK